MSKKKQEEQSNKDKPLPKYKALGFDSQLHYNSWLSFNGLESSSYSPLDNDEFDVYGDFSKKPKKSKVVDKETEDLYDLDIEETIKEYGKL